MGEKCFLEEELKVDIDSLFQIREIIKDKEDTTSFCLPKDYIIRQKKIIDSLFKKGHSVFHYPIKAVYLSDPSLSTDNELSELILFSVSKKRFKKASDRNAIKRLLRESFRLNFRDRLQVSETLTVKIALIYVGKKLYSFDFVEKAVVNILNDINHAIQS